MDSVTFGVMFALGLVSSLHCAQMCGPIVLAYSMADEQLVQINGTRRVLPQAMSHVAYNSGRILTYSLLGAVAGVLGHTLGLLGRIAGVATALALVAGGLMVVVGLVMLRIVPASLLGSRLFTVPARFMKPLGGLLSSPRVSRRFLLGLALGFLPCGLIYAALLKAMAAGSALDGALTMLAFGLGTAGALLAIGLFSSAIRGPVSRWGSQLAALSVTAMGALLIWRGMMPPMIAMGPHCHGIH